MNSFGTERTHRIAAPFRKAVRQVRSALAGAGLELAGEWDEADAGGRCKVLLVDSPLLLLQALVLDRAAAVYLPVHVVLRSKDGETQAAIVSPAGLPGTRLPTGAAGPIARTQAQITEVLAALETESARAQRAD